MNNSALLLCLLVTITYSLHITAAADTKLRVGGGGHRHIEEDSTITCPHPVLAEVAYTNGSDESYIACEQSNGIINKVDLSYEDVTKHKNDVANGKVEVVLPEGSSIDAKGTIVVPKDKTCSFKTKTKTGMKKKNGSITPWGNRRRLSINGTKTVLMVRVNALDVDNSHTEEELSDAVFGTSGRLVSLKSQYGACSNGKLNFVPATGVDIVDGKFGILAHCNLYVLVWYLTHLALDTLFSFYLSKHLCIGITTVNLDINAKGGDRKAFESNVTTILNSRFDVDSPSELADHIMMCMPAGTTGDVFGNWAAYAYVGSSLSSFNDEW